MDDKIKDDILADAIQHLIEAEHQIIVLKRIILALTTMIVAGGIMAWIGLC